MRNIRTGLFWDYDSYFYIYLKYKHMHTIYMHTYIYIYIYPFPLHPFSFSSHSPNGPSERTATFHHKCFSCDCFFVFRACHMKVDITFSFRLSINKQKSDFQKATFRGRRALMFSTAEPRRVPWGCAGTRGCSRGNTDTPTLKYSTKAWQWKRWVLKQSLRSCFLHGFFLYSFFQSQLTGNLHLRTAA